MCDAKKCNSCSFKDFEKQYTNVNSIKYEIGKPYSMLLGLTNRCNMRCPYCFETHNNNDMTLEIAENAMEWFLSTANPHTVAFFGGEPLLKYEEIIVPIVEKYHDKIQFDITTNGALLDEDKIDFFRKYNITPLLSFDGVSEVQNKQRPGCGFNSFFTVLKNIPYYLLRFPEGMVRSTLTKDSIPYLYESVKFLYNLGFKYISFYPNTFEDWDDNTFFKYEKQLTLIGEWVYTKMPDVPHITNLEKAIYKVDNIDNLSIDNEIQRCGMGTISCSVTFDGKIIPCQEKLPNPNHIIGNIYEGIDKAKVEEYIQWYLKQIQNIKCPEKCDNKIHLLCKSVACPSRLEDLNFKLSTSHCYSNIALYRLAMRLNYLCGHTYKGKFFKEGGSI